MADAALFVGYGQAARARERQAIELFNQALEYFTDLKNQGLVESFEPVLLEPHGGDMRGFILLRGAPDNLNRIRADEQFQQMLARARLVVDNFGVVGAFIGGGLQAQMGIYREQVESQLRA